MKIIVPTSIKTTFKLYLLSIFVFSFFRMILYITNWDKIFDFGGNFSTLTFLQSIFMGIRFDIVVSGYLLLIPFFFLFIIEAINIKNKLINSIIFGIIYIIYFPSLLICAADVPYFNHFFARFSISAFQWTENPDFMFKMIIQEPSYILIIFPFIVIYYTFTVVGNKIADVHLKSQAGRPVFLSTIFAVLFILLMVLGIRGRIEEKSPIRIGTAYFSNNPFLNMAGLNPVFVFIRSFYDSQKKENQYLNLIDESEAIENVRKFLSINDNNKFSSDYPIARIINPDSTTSKKFNIVLVIMESMSAQKMSYFGNKQNLTPFLDSIAKKGIFFNKIYTAGIHTYNGIFSTLFAFPALFGQHSMEDSRMVKYNGISHTLKKHNYYTTFFTTHDGQFDNVEGFLYHNYFDKVYTQKDYPSEKIMSTLGVTDDYLFEYAVNEIDKFHTNNKPFFVSIMTASDHGPYIIPKYFKPKSKEIKEQIVEYADWSIQKFIKSSETKDWFDNTIFVFVADHGGLIEPLTYEMPLSYHHTPLIFYAPKLFLGNKIIDKIGGQIDVFPTIMGLLNLPYINNTMGIDLLNNNREFIYFSADEKLGVLSDDFYLIINKQTGGSLFDYKNNSTHNYTNEYAKLAKIMEIYAYSHLQTYQYLLKKDKIFIK